MFVHVYDANGRRIAIADADLKNNTLPLAQWRDFVYDQRNIQLPEQSAQAAAVQVKGAAGVGCGAELAFQVVHDTNWGLAQKM